ncbi:glycosyltransferase family 2 protein [Agrobacterium sp. ES01]|uniref:glycosyltransferase family 2 protein n=1 Tax=Agrobacterium sp. ES01 TaxID=3420714 RepID=UPI003D1146BF
MMAIEAAQAVAAKKPVTTLPGLALVIGIPSAGRRDILTEVVPHLARQTRQPAEILICVPRLIDVDAKALSLLPCPVRILLSQRGLCKQRNAILDAVPDADVVLFLDDDFLLAPTYLAELELLFQNNPDADISTGTVIADGISGPGISLAAGLDLLRNIPTPSDESPLRDVFSGYGCNLAVRMSAVHIGRLRFDENLPLYGWLEDLDFSRTAVRYGRVVISPRLIGVHLGTKVGRTSNFRLGYSQVANPIYLMRKKTMSFRQASVRIGRNVLANFVKVWRAEPWIDRKGRLKGNMLAFRDLLSGRLAPQNIERL